MQVRVEQLAAEKRLLELSSETKKEYADVFQLIPHINKMPDNVLCKITLKDADRMITTRNYSCPWKFHEVWSILIQWHLDVGCIRPSCSAHALPAFLVPKADTTDLPCWVNDYWQLNSNTMTNSHLLPRIDNILADAGRGKIWSKLDMMDSFFHTKMDPNCILLTAVMTLLGLSSGW